MSWVGEHAAFVSSFLRDWRTTGSIAPSSRWLAAEMIRGAGLETAETIVEAGAGMGSLTAPILAAARPGALVMAVELNNGFAARLAEKFPGLAVVAGSVEHLPDHLAAAGRPHADCVLSSLPWASLPRDVQVALLAAIAGALRPGGTFATYTYLQALAMPGSRFFRRQLGRHFSAVSRSPVVWRNLPPAFVIRARR